MPDVLVANDDITVLGPPNVIELSVDIGPKGDRGSQIFVGIGDPNSIDIGQVPEFNDMYINTSPGANYGYMYQYRSEPGGALWVETLKINPVIYSKNILTNYSSGLAEITIPIVDIVSVSGQTLTEENFNIQYSILNSNPVASSISEINVTSSNIVITLKAVESSAGVWQALDEDGVLTHIFVSIVA